MEKSTKLDKYRTWKTELKIEKYLQRNEMIKQNRYWTQLRCGSSELRVETMRYGRDRRERQDRQCVMCASGGVEDEEHLLFDCTAYTNMRNKMIDEVERKTMGQIQLRDENKEVSRRQRMNWMMNGEREEVRKETRQYIQKALITRMQLTKESEKRQNMENAETKKRTNEMKKRAKQETLRQHEQKNND